MVETVGDDVIGSFEQGWLLPQVMAPTELRDGDLLKGSADNIYVVQGGQRQWIPDIASFTRLGYTWNRVKIVFDSVLDTLRSLAETK